MKFSIGDRVLLKRTGEEGYVRELMNDEMLEVEVGGTTFPVYIDEIDHPYFKWFTAEKINKKPTTLPQMPAEKPAERKQRLAKGVYLSFMPVFKTKEVEDIVDYMKVFLLNEMPVDIRFSYDVRLQDHSDFRHEGQLHAFGNIYLNNIAWDNMNDQPKFCWTLKDANDPKMEGATGVLKIKAVKLFEHINKCLENNEPSFSYLLIEEFLLKKVPEPVVKPEFMEKPWYSINSSKLESARHEIDLHIEQLVSNPTILSNDEILKKQMDTLEKYLHLAIAHHQEKMVVIHGLGKGKLREEVHKMLKKTPEISRYKNEWSGKYGFGATEVTFRYK